MDFNERAMEIEVIRSDGDRSLLILQHPMLGVVYTGTGYTIGNDVDVVDMRDKGLTTQGYMCVTLPMGQTEVWIKYNPETNILPEIRTVAPTEDKKAYRLYSHVYKKKGSRYVSQWDQI